jgi:hypothetical protein
VVPLAGKPARTFASAAADLQKIHVVVEGA